MFSKWEHLAELSSQPLAARYSERSIQGGAKDGDWYKLSKKDGSATGFYLAELKCPNSYYDKNNPENHYCAMEFRCYLDDSATGFTYTLHDDC